MMMDAKSIPKVFSVKNVIKMKLKNCCIILSDLFLFGLLLKFLFLDVAKP